MLILCDKKNIKPISVWYKLESNDEFYSIKINSLSSSGWEIFEVLGFNSFKPEDGEIFLD